MKLIPILRFCRISIPLAFFTSCGNGVNPNELVTPKVTQSDGGSATEKQMAALVRGHSSQKRTQLVWDSRLASAARARALDMGKRGYFSHIDPDGYGPNWYVTQAGYRLPIQWTAFKSENQVESILAGSNTSQGAFDRWMGSRKHTSHLLAINPFYRNQTRFGVAHVVLPNSQWKDYWVFISAPPEK